MNAVATPGQRTTSLDHLAADLASAAYRVALQRGAVGSWLDLQLEIWQTMREALRRQAAPRRA